jgi:hypothetical protein
MKCSVEWNITFRKLNYWKCSMFLKTQHLITHSFSTNCVNFSHSFPLKQNEETRSGTLSGVRCFQYKYKFIHFILLVITCWSTVDNFFWLQHKRVEETFETSEFAGYNITSNYSMCKLMYSLWNTADASYSYVIHLQFRTEYFIHSDVSFCHGMNLNNQWRISNRHSRCFCNTLWHSRP